MDIRPFDIAIGEDVLQDLMQRLSQARLPASLDAQGWEDGAALVFMRRLLDHWRHRFDWREQERRLNRLPNYVATIDGLRIHFVHQPGVGPAPMPLILTHGWPGSFVEMERLIPLLSDPAAHGGDPADAFHVVVPSLPGYGFSEAPQRPGKNARAIAGMWRTLMAGLGYDRFGAQGGDIGAGVSMWLARTAPAALTGVHLNYIPGSFAPTITDHDPAITAEEQAFLAGAARFAADEAAYAALHATKPQTLAYALSDSPVGLAAWIAEKFHAWSDCDGDLESVIPLDTVLTDIALYWFSGTIDASLRLYKENRQDPLTFGPGERVVTPLGVAVFPRELPMPPRVRVERVFDVQHWSVMPKGGHFAALEQPELLAKDIRTFFRLLRSS